MSVPDLRVRVVNRCPVRGDGLFVLYWMIAARRTRFSFALQRAVEEAERLRRPLLVLEALRSDYAHASDRLHAFVLQGMEANRTAFQGTPARYYPYVEPERGAGKGLLESLAADACLVITDDYPSFFLPRMVAAAGERLGVRLEAVDGNGLLPLAAAPSQHATAVSFRRHLHRHLPLHLGELPEPDPLTRTVLPPCPELPETLERRWPAAAPALLAARPGALARLPVDHSVPAVSMTGGQDAASAALVCFLHERLANYSEASRHPDAGATSGLSPYLHFGHLGAHEAFVALAVREGWSPGDLAARAHGRREGWWGLSPPAEGWLDELVTWRELGFNTLHQRPDAHRFETLPDWARATLEAHADDPREHLYQREALESATTGDEVWNAAQRQLVTEGVIHSYLRMLWGKNILRWTRHPCEALELMLELNDRWALDGRDPNSVSGITWVLGRYDHPWPERPVLGRVRSMTSRSTLRKLRMARYLECFGPSG